MPIYTTYLGNKPKSAAERIGSCFVYFVMCNRGNDDVAPYIETVQAYKKGKLSWDDYKIIYLRKINTSNGPEWMEKRAQEAKLVRGVTMYFDKVTNNVCDDVEPFSLKTFAISKGKTTRIFWVSEDQIKPVETVQTQLSIGPRTERFRQRNMRQSTGLDWPWQQSIEKFLKK